MMLTFRRGAALVAAAATLAAAGTTLSPNAQAANNKTTVTITPSGTQTYGGTPSYSYTAAPSGTYSISGTLSCTSATNSGTGAGTYSTTGCSGLSISPANDFQLAYATGSLAITRAPLTVRAPSASKVYGAPVTALPTPSYTGFVLGQTSAVLTSLASCSTSAVASSPVGTFSTSCTGAAAANYSFIYVNGALTVTPAPLTVTGTSTSRAYGAANDSLGPVITGLVNNDKPSVYASNAGTCTTTATTSSPVGTYPVTCSGTNAGGNYTPVFVAGSVTVGPAQLTVTAPSPTRTYGDANPTLSPAVTGFVNGQTSAVLTSVPTCSTTATVTSSAGTYPVTCSGAAAPNYTVSYVGGSLTVGKRLLTVTAPTRSVTYGESAGALAPDYSGFVNGDSAGSLTQGASCDSPVTSSTPVGSYTSTCSGAQSANYAFSYVPGTISVTKKALEVATSGTQVYGSSPSYAYAVTEPEGVDVVGSLSCTTSGLSASSHVGTYPVSSCSGLSLSGSNAGNYEIDYLDTDVTVTPAPATVTAPSPSKAYGAALPTLTATVDGLVNGDVLDTDCTTTASEASPVVTGGYPVSCAYVPNDDYSVSVIGGVLTVTPAALSVTSSGSKTYGDAVLTLSPAYSGLVLGETAPATPATCSTTATDDSHVGTFPVTCSGAADANYAISYADGVYTVLRASVTVSGSGTKTYGDAVPTIAAVATGLVNGDVALDEPGTCQTTAEAASHVGSYTVTCEGASDSDYDVSYATGAFAVTPAPLTVMALSTTKVYGAALPELEYSFVGLVNEDSDADISTAPTCSTGATESSDVGEYEITCTGAQDEDYAITLVPGTLTVTPAPLTVTASSHTGTYGDKAPKVTAVYDGFVLGQDESALAGTLLCKANGLNAGMHTTTCEGLTSDNYDITYEAGTYEVAKKALTVTADSASGTYGDADPAIGASYDGFVYDEDETDLGGLLQCGAESHDAGENVTSCGGLTPDNYAVTFVTGTYSVEKAPLTVTAHDAEGVYGDGDPALTATTNGFVFGEDSSVLGGTLACTVDGVTAGSHVISCTGWTSDNYAITFVDGTYTVAAKALTAQARSYSATYGDPVPSVEVDWTGFVYHEAGTDLVGTLSCSVTGTHVATSNRTTCSGLSSPNYAITYVDGTYTVSPKALTGTASSHTGTYGDVDPTVTASWSGFAAGETANNLTGTLACAISGHGAGTNATSCSGLTSTDYDVSYVNGTYTVGKATLGVTTANVTRDYGTVNPAFPAQYTGFKFADSASSLTTTPSCSSAATATSAPGTYDITCGGGVGANYAFAYTKAVLTVKATFKYSELLQPINVDRSSVFKSGSTIPVKFQVKDLNGVVIDASSHAYSIRVVAVGSTAGSTVNETAVTAAGDAGTAFRWDPSGKQFIYNLSTKTTPMLEGQYRIDVLNGAGAVVTSGYVSTKK